MVVQVGDKVLVYGAGTPWAFAKKIEPVEVGDKVDVVTLSDGTKLAMPKIEMDLSEYVWVVPEFDVPFNIGDVPFQWGMMPLGAAVFSVTGIIDCWTVEDIYRGWDTSEISLINCLIFILSGAMKGVIYIIQGFTPTTYKINFLDDGPLDYTDFTVSTVWYPTYEINESTLDIKCLKSEGVSLSRSNVQGKSAFSLPYRIRQRSGVANNVKIEFEGQPYSYQYIMGSVYANSVLSEPELVFYELDPLDLVNPSFPGYDVFSTLCPANIQKLRITTSAYWNTYDYIHFEAGAITWVDDDCPTERLAAGDKYIIYNPVTKRLVFNDATKSLTASNWQTGGEGAEISSSPVEYVWDGQGYVYLTSSKTIFSTIQFDDLLQVQAVHGETARTIPFHLGERIAQGDETVSRELTNITSILRSGKNTITLTAKNQDGTKVGFVTAVYVKRSMTAVSL